jgi:antitoxin component YwqK of YwqJK toxin-antitoxin module
MIMNKWAFLLFIPLFLLGCGPRKVIESRFDNGNPQVVKYYEKIDGKDQVVKETIYYKNKNKKMEGEYQSDQRTGKWSAWFEDGKMWSIGEYKDGKRNGPGIVYHTNGKKYIESFYTNDEKTGNWRFYDTTGMVVKEVNFDEINRKLISDTLK